MSERAYVEGTIESYLNRLAAADPEPGGGSAAALAGALGAALVSMVTNLTLGKEKFAAVQDDVAELKKRSEALRAKLEELVTLDALAYREVAAAMKMPKDTGEQQEQRRQVMQVALKGAAEVPLKVAEAAVEVARLSLPAAEKGNPNAVSDAGVAVLLADAAAHSAALNARINLVWIEDEDVKRGTWARIEAILSETGRMRDIVLAVTYSKIW